eukprot:tig00000808_g4432.t1
MEQLIRTLNKLQEAFSLLDLPEDEQPKLPRICVVGGQSAGKSTVLECVVGKSFLPRGSGIVTRRPLQLQLINLPDRSAREFGEFSHAPGRRFWTYEEIRDEIVAETERSCGKLNVSPVPIILTISSPDVLTMSLVDLPGLVKVPIKGQADSTPREIEEMVLQYIRDRNTVILAVTPANIDCATSDALAIARRPDVDPQGQRTLGVFTKCDMPTNSDVQSALKNDEYTLRLGYIAVANPRPEAGAGTGTGGKAAKMDGVEDLRAARGREEAFFASDPRFADPRLRPSLGYAALERRLSSLYAGHVRECMPGVASQLEALLAEKEAEVADLGVALTSPAERADRVMELLFAYAKGFESRIDGTAPDVSDTELQGGARINYVYNQVLRQDLKAMHISKTVSLADILLPRPAPAPAAPSPSPGCLLDGRRAQLKTVLQNVAGTTVQLFASNQAFAAVIAKYVAALREPVRKCLDYVYMELRSIAELAAAGPELEAYPRLREAIRRSAEAYLAALYEKSREFTRTLIEMERCRVNIDHPAFIPFREEVYGDSDAARPEFDATAGAPAAEGAPRPRRAGGPGPRAPEAPEGRVLKASAAFTRFQERFARLEGATLRYHKLARERAKGGDRAWVYRAGELKDKIELRAGETVVERLDTERESKGRAPHGLVLRNVRSAAKRERAVFAFALETEAERDAWVDAIQRALAPPAPREEPEAGPAPGSSTARARGPQQRGMNANRRRSYDINGWQPLPSSIVAGSIGEREERQLNDIHYLLCGYFYVVCQNIEDAVPKAISLLLVAAAKQGLLQELVAHVTKGSSAEELLSLDAEREAAAERALEGVRLLRDAKTAIAGLSASLAALGRPDPAPAPPPPSPPPLPRLPRPRRPGRRRRALTAPPRPLPAPSRGLPPPPFVEIRDL